MPIRQDMSDYLEHFSRIDPLSVLTHGAQRQSIEASPVYQQWSRERDREKMRRHQRARHARKRNLQTRRVRLTHYLAVGITPVRLGRARSISTPRSRRSIGVCSLPIFSMTLGNNAFGD